MSKIDSQACLHFIHSTRTVLGDIMNSTLLQCFSQHLPKIVIKSSKAIQTSESSRTVKNEKAPRILITDTGGQYWNIADRYLKENSESLAEEYLGIPERDPEVLNEADVVSHARFNLVRPVVRALEHGRLAGKIKVCSELQTEALRVDLGVAYESDEGRHIVMMIEYKKVCLIRPRFFEQAMWSKVEVDKDSQPLKNNDRRYLSSTSSELKLVKQAKAYAKRANCLYVALCDYESLILLNFSERLDVVNVTIVDKTQIRFRKALLGFLLTAVEHYKDEPTV